MSIQCISDGTRLVWGRLPTLSPITMELKYSRWNNMRAGSSFKTGRNGWGFRWIKVGIELIIVEAEWEIHTNMRSSLYHSLFVIFYIYCKIKRFCVYLNKTVARMMFFHSYLYLRHLWCFVFSISEFPYIHISVTAQGNIHCLDEVLQLRVLKLNKYLLKHETSGYCLVSPSQHVLPNSRGHFMYWAWVPEMPGRHSLHSRDSCGKRQQLILKNAAIWVRSSVFILILSALLNMEVVGYKTAFFKICRCSHFSPIRI